MYPRLKDEEIIKVDIKPSKIKSQKQLNSQSQTKINYTKAPTSFTPTPKPQQVQATQAQATVTTNNNTNETNPKVPHKNLMKTIFLVINIGSAIFVFATGL